jgi:cyclohexanecarboxylate-CoA ligase
VTNSTFSERLRAQATQRPDQTAVVDRDRRIAYAELDRRVDAAATALRARGVEPGQVVSSQLPNRLESMVLFFAANRIGAIHNPIGLILGAREVRFILSQAQSAIFVVPRSFRGTDHVAMAARVRPALPHLRDVLVVDDVESPLEPPESDELTFADPAGKADDVAVLLYTSGTTADPKGVLHSNRTLLAECEVMAAFHGLTTDDRFVMPSPVSHISGLLYGVLLPVHVGGTSVLMDVWDPGGFLELVERERGTFSAGATPFLAGVVDHPDLGRFDHSSLRTFPCGGADVPPELIRQAIGRLGVRTGRGYGSTEFPSITSSAGRDDPADKRATTDGRPIGHNRIQLREGEVWALGPELFLGYCDRTLDSAAFDEKGYFCTGDLGIVDADGYLTITGRAKDIVIRAGEKFSTKEIEDLLYEHPKVAEVAVVPAPDTQVGERACAFIVPRIVDDPPTLAEIVHFLASKELSRRKLPERIVHVRQLPTTASGKVQKHLLVQRLRAEAEERGDP